MWLPFRQPPKAAVDGRALVDLVEGKEPASVDWCSVARYLRRILRVITTEVLLRVLVSGGRLLVKLRVEIITKLLVFLAGVLRGANETRIEGSI